MYPSYACAHVLACVQILGRLNSYLREEDSIQACLVTGEAGFGMTTCIAKW